MTIREHTVTITDDDIHFVELAVEHYRLFAETSEKHGQARTAGILRKQEFYAERFLLRLTEGSWGPRSRRPTRSAYPGDTP